MVEYSNAATYKALKEAENREAEYGKEMFFRRLKNRKIELDEAALTQLIKKLGFKTATKFFSNVAQDKIDINATIDKFVEISKESEEENIHQRSAEDYVQQTPTQQYAKEDVLVIDGSLKDIEYKLSKCCNPIYGDEIFGFVNSQGGIKIHRVDCPNAPELRGRFGYRVVPAKWSGKHGSQYVVVLRVVGNDDIGIVTNITSIISKESGVAMRSISIDSNDGLFQGHITVTVSHVPALNGLIKKLKNVKGVKNVERTTE